ncbi:hypothetical protein CDAR_584991 [Caerostris darwini]|uniref:Uncharacterized protein n=1 Tax=Caerostris darwini TaxID=1538125 RepID=A0AAV4Q685_9ARAC|nr:hypothetical protein CDAR_584991 [Caerostris darwini]
MDGKGCPAHNFVFGRLEELKLNFSITIRRLNVKVEWERIWLIKGFVLKSKKMLSIFSDRRDTIYQEFHPQGQGRMEKKLADESCFDIKKGAHLL